MVRLVLLRWPTIITLKLHDSMFSGHSANVPPANNYIKPVDEMPVVAGNYCSNSNSIRNAFCHRSGVKPAAWPRSRGTRVNRFEHVPSSFASMRREDDACSLTGSYPPPRKWWDWPSWRGLVKGTCRVLRLDWKRPSRRRFVLVLWCASGKTRHASAHAGLVLEETEQKPRPVDDPRPNRLSRVRGSYFPARR